MAITITATANTTDKSITLNQRNTVVDQEPNAQQIIWQLTGTSATGKWTGFSWKGTSQPSSSVIAPPSPDGTSNQMTATDNNTSASSQGGPWIYQVTALVDGVTCSTTSTVGITGGTTDPTIKNN